MASALIYPQRQRCRKCRRYFGVLVIDGLFDSYECADLPYVDRSVSPDPLIVPRECRKHWRGGWDWKVPYLSKEEATGRAGWMNSYKCSYCKCWHNGHGPGGE